MRHALCALKQDIPNTKENPRTKKAPHLTRDAALCTIDPGADCAPGIILICHKIKNVAKHTRITFV
jgi:hypothetical protein